MTYFKKKFIVTIIFFIILIDLFPVIMFRFFITEPDKRKKFENYSYNSKIVTSYFFVKEYFLFKKIFKIKKENDELFYSYLNKNNKKIIFQKKSEKKYFLNNQELTLKKYSFNNKNSLGSSYIKYYKNNYFLVSQSGLLFKKKQDSSK